MGMYGADMGVCRTCRCPIEAHCADDHWCSKCGGVGHDIKLKPEWDGVEFADG